MCGASGLAGGAHAAGSATSAKPAARTSAAAAPASATGAKNCRRVAGTLVDQSPLGTIKVFRVKRGASVRARICVRTGPGKATIRVLDLPDTWRIYGERYIAGVDLRTSSDENEATANVAVVLDLVANTSASVTLLSNADVAFTQGGGIAFRGIDPATKQQAVLALDGAGPRSLGALPADAHDIELAVTGNTVYWTTGGVPQRAVLNGAATALAT